MTKDIFAQIPENILKYVQKQNIKELRPSQEKSIKKGLFKNNHNQIVCTPTGSGKTLVAEFAMLDTLLNKQKKVIYEIMPMPVLGIFEQQD